MSSGRERTYCTKYLLSDEGKCECLPIFIPLRLTAGRTVVRNLQRAVHTPTPPLSICFCAPTFLPALLSEALDGGAGGGAVHLSLAPPIWAPRWPSQATVPLPSRTSVSGPVGGASNSMPVQAQH